MKKPSHQRNLLIERVRRLENEIYHFSRPGDDEPEAKKED